MAILRHRAGVNAGFFLRRQYCEFLNRKLGSLPQQLAEKGAELGHIEVLDYGQRRHVYHLKSRAIYVILGNQPSDHHRPKGDAEIKTRLMVLDYLLACRKQRLLTLDQEKLEFFLDALQVPKNILPSAFSMAPDRTTPLTARYFVERFPILVDAGSTGERPIVHFSYFDYGALSIKRFARFLDKYKPLLEKLGTFGITYIATSSRNLATAQRKFNRAFPRTSRLLPFGFDHITGFLEAQVRWDRNDPTFSHQDLSVLKEGEKVYTLPEHTQLREAWLKGRRQFDDHLARLGEKQLTQGTFTSLILQRTYPIFGNRYRGKPAEKAVNSQIHSISNFESIAS